MMLVKLLQKINIGVARAQNIARPELINVAHDKIIVAVLRMQ